MFNRDEAERKKGADGLLLQFKRSKLASATIVAYNAEDSEIPPTRRVTVRPALLRPWAEAVEAELLASTENGEDCEEERGEKKGV